MFNMKSNASKRPNRIITLKYPLKRIQSSSPQATLASLLSCEALTIQSSSKPLTKVKRIQTENEDLSVVTKLDRTELIQLTNQTSLNNIKQNSPTTIPIQYKTFSYSPGYERYSASPRDRMIIEQNKEVMHRSFKLRSSTPRKRNPQAVKVIMAKFPNYNCERGRMISSHSQRYVSKLATN